MDSAQTDLLRELLDGTAWFGECRGFARTLRRAPRSPGGLLLVGTPEEEPWHLAAHLDTEAGLSGLPQLAPTLVRHQVPDGAPPHLAVPLNRLVTARRGEAVLVVAPDDPGGPLLERVDDARRRGAAILTMAEDEDSAGELLSLSHDALLVPESGVVPGFDAAQHLLASSAGEQDRRRRGFRDRLTALIDQVSGGSADTYR
ncbi:hypothetical protein GCM10009839_28730 [Catenulispora yoronensis]|uniref:Uncharacterized protein n=1 Tax=Catenulispora yoronensis TaxID=450799 RepID=A0ABN2U2T4_9ACTN